MKKIKKAFKRIKVKNLIILIILLMFNAYAWFVFSTKVSSKIEAHVEAWDIVFQADEKEIVSNIKFEVGKIYPRHERI